MTQVPFLHFNVCIACMSYTRRDAWRTWCSWLSGEPWSEKWWWADEKWSCHRFYFPDRDPVTPFPSSRLIPANLIKNIGCKCLSNPTSNKNRPSELRRIQFFYRRKCWSLTINLTWRLHHCEFFHLIGSRSLMPVIVPINLQGKDYTISGLKLTEFQAGKLFGSSYSCLR